MEKNTFTVVNDQGQEIVCYVLFTFESDETHKNYVVYTDNSVDASGKIQVFASIYDPEEKDGTTLLPIETEKEWKIIETILSSLQEEIKNKKKPEDQNNEQ